jgi:DNA-binding response OmpR family regulator
VRKKILVVEDDLDLVELLKFNLTNAGFSVTAATGGGEGLKKARTWLPDLILLDLMLPELNGFAVCEILRRDGSTREIPIIILTAMPGQLARVAGMGSSADDYICKPFSPKNLLKRIETLLTRVSGPHTAQAASKP